MVLTKNEFFTNQARTGEWSMRLSTCYSWQSFLKENTLPMRSSPYISQSTIIQLRKCISGLIVYSLLLLLVLSHFFPSSSLITTPQLKKKKNSRLRMANQSMGAAWILRAAAVQCIWCVTFCFVLLFYCCCGNGAKIAATAVLLNNHQRDSTRCVSPSLGKKNVHIWYPLPYSDL